MTELETLQKQENRKNSKSRRNLWIRIIAIFSALLLAYMSGNLLCKVGLFQTKKVMSNWWTDEESLKPENHAQLPADWTEWYKDLKENVWYRNFGQKEEYFTKGEIAKRKAKEQGESWLGEWGGRIAEYLASQGISEAEAKKVDYHQYANHVYGHTALFLIISWILFYLVFYLLLRYLVLPLSWKEPKLIEQKN